VLRPLRGLHAGLVKRSNTTDCKSVGLCLRRFESYTLHQSISVMKNDKYSQSRGGWSRILDITCDSCDKHVCYYQKDGPGPLKRMYIDRMSDAQPNDIKLVCANCNNELGIRITYAKENRPAYRLFQGSVNKRITKQSGVK
jgi:uncharacterized CHY-type Zn-finger protein